jgi:putative redox protein
MIQASAKWIAETKDGTKFEGHSSHSITMDGSSQSGNSPMELVLIALCGCTAYDVVTILQKKREPFTAVEVHAEAEKAVDPPRVYTAIKLVYRVKGQVARKAVEDAVKLSEEKYCSIAAMLNKTAKITYEIELDPK